MKRLKKISYEFDFSDSDSTIIDVEMGVSSNTNEATNAMSTESTSAKSTTDNYLLHKFLDKDENDDELETIMRKYGNPSSKPSRQLKLQTVQKMMDDTIELSSDEEVPEVVDISTKYKCFSPNNDNNLDLPDYNLIWNDAEPQSSNQKNAIENNSKTKKLNCQSSIDKELKKKEKAKKQEEVAKQKQIKQALLAVTRSMKPENCMKFLTVTIDSNIANEKYGGEILNALQALEVTYKLESQLIPNTVTWTRKSLQHTLDDNALTETTEDSEVDEALLILNWKEVVNLINEETLLSHIESIKSILNKSKIFILLYDLENYFKYRKRQKGRDFKNSVTQTSHKINSKNDKLYEGVPKIQRSQLETSLTELQILHSCCHQLIENPQDMGEMVAHFTKSVALVPYKLEKYQKQQQTEWFMSGDNRDTVKVDKNGNGLRRLWQQQLTTFPLVRLELAEAIVAKYPTFRSLLEDCNKSEHDEKLLQELPIRRAAGPLTTVRRIGPELSKKIYTYFTSTDGELPI